MLMPQVTFGTGSCRSFNLQANFGQRPFLFDMERTCVETNRRSFQIAVTLPMEILEQIALDALEASVEFLEYNFVDIARYARRDVNRLSLVCRRWHTISSLLLNHALTIKNSTDFERALSLPSLSKLRVLLTNEDGTVPWIHRLLVSPLPSQLASITQWTCDSQNIQFLDRLPPRISRAVPSLFRTHLTNVRILRFDDCSFKQWSHFARIVYAFPHLDELRLWQVDWSDLPKMRTPPTRLLYFRRLRELNVIIGSVSHGHYWLFIASGKLVRSEATKDSCSRDLLLSPEDTLVVADIMRLMPNLCRVNEILYSEENNKCTSFAVICSSLLTYV